MAVAGCRPARPRPILPDTLPTASDLLATVAARRQAVTSVRGMARIAWERGEERIGARHVVVVAPPDRFRLEVLSPLGAVAVATCDGPELAVWVRREHRTYRGPATAESMAAYAGLPIDVADVAAVLVGLTPERRVTGHPTVARDDAAGLLRVSAAFDGGRQEIWFAPDSRLPVASETTLDPTRVLRVELDDYRTIAGVAFPLDVDARVLPDGGRVHVRWEPPTIGVTIADDLFIFPVRAGVDEVHLDQYRAGETQ
jgi:outer membrane lipoprotein-sorting protein